jgi:hypothetical protein
MKYGHVPYPFPKDRPHFDVKNLSNPELGETASTSGCKSFRIRSMASGDTLCQTWCFDNM